jgi:hypothetical protein
LKKKSDQVVWLVDLFKDLKSTHVVIVRRVRCDNAGENNSLQKECVKERLGIQIEFTPLGTPEYNGRVERKFTTLYSQVGAMLNGARLPKSLRGGLWPEAALRATDLENIYTTATKPVASNNQFFEKDLPGLRNFRVFGEIGIVTHHEDNVSDSFTKNVTGDIYEANVKEFHLKTLLHWYSHNFTTEFHHIIL